MDYLDNCNFSDEQLYHEFCTEEDKETILGIKEAVANLEKKDYSFEEFDLRLTETDESILEQLVIKKPFAYSNCGDLYNFTKVAESTLKQVGDKGENDEIIGDISKLISRIVNNIIDASGYNSAYVFVGALVKPTSNDSVDTGSVMPYWHIDKTVEEILLKDKELNSTKPDAVHLFTLKGTSTYYHPLNETSHQQFIANSYIWKLTYEHPCHYYNCDENMSVGYIKNMYEFMSSKFGYGSVHLSGKERGTVHAIPHFNDGRITTIVTPMDGSLIKDYCNLRYEIIFGSDS